MEATLSAKITHLAYSVKNENITMAEIAFIAEP